MLYQRYSNPLTLIDKMLLTGRFKEFIDKFITTHNEEQEEKTLWEFYLHRVFDQSFVEFKNSLALPKQEDIPTETDLQNIVTGSIGILTDFNPFEGVDSHGAIQTAGVNSD